MGTQPSPQKAGRAPPQFSGNFYCAQTAGCMTMPLGMEVGLSPGDFVFDGDPAPKSGRSPRPNFRPMSIMAKRLDGSRWHLAWRWAFVHATLCWMGNQLPSPQKGAEPLPVCGPFLLSPNGWMNQDDIWHGGGLGPSHIVLDRDTAPLPNRGQSPQFSAHFTARRFASAVLVTAIPSVGLPVRLSVSPSDTFRYCVKTTARSTVQFGLSDSKMCLVLLKPKNIPQGRPLPP